MLIILLLIWACWLIQAIVCAIQVYKFTRRLQQTERPKFAEYRPVASIIVPVKGLDDDLAVHVRALCEQEYPQYQIVFVVESQDDPAYAVLQQQLQGCAQRRWRILVAGIAGRHVGQKVHNQLAALKVLDAECSDQEVWVFADADAVPTSQWLARLIGPLRRTTKTGMTSGYRWLIPQAQSARSPSLWSHLACVCNSSVACQLGEYWINQAWGGAMAVRVDIARQGKLQELLAGAITDDYQFTLMCRSLKLRIAFVPESLVASPVMFDRSGFFNFAHRQYLITRVYAPGVYLVGLGAMSLYVAGYVSSVTLLISGTVPRIWPALAMLGVLVANHIRSSLRSLVIERAFGKTIRRRMRATLRIDRWLTTVWMTLHWLIMLRAGFGRTITWRNMGYRLYGRQKIERLSAPHVRR